MKTFAAVFGLLLLCGPLGADVALFEGPPGGVGDLRVYDESGVLAPSAPAGLQGIQLLPIECSGRSMLDSLQADRPQLRSDLPGATRILLPFGKGSLYRYRRDDVGGSVFGYFLVRADGTALNLFEVPGTGVLGTEDPIPGHVGLDPAAASMLVGTSLAAGGNLIEIDLESGLSVDRTSAVGPMDFLTGSMRLLSTWGVALARTGALRFDRSVGGQASRVPLPAWGDPVLAFTEISASPFAYLGEGVAASADESCVSIVAGVNSNQAHVFVFGATGSATRVTSTPRALQGAGYLPGCRIGPTLALAPDGSCVSFRSTGSTAEAWTRSTGESGPPAFQITADARFVDTLGETGVIGFLSPLLLILVVGESSVQAIENADVYRVDLATRTISNISFTSGQAQLPFTGGLLNTDEGVWQLPDASGVLVVQAFSGGVRELLMVPWNAGPAIQVLDQLKSLDGVTVAGSDLVLDARRSDPIKRRELLRWSPSQPGTSTVLGSFDDACHFVSQVGGPSGMYAAILDCLPGQWIGRLNVPLGTGMQLTSQPLQYGVPLGVTPSGAIAATLLLPSRTFLFTWSSAGAVSTVAAVNSAAHVLPGM